MADATKFLLFFFLSVSIHFIKCSPSYTVKVFSQTVDHFNYLSLGESKFDQRYLIQEKWWLRGKGPIFFYTGNELPITAFWESAGFLFDIAPKFEALVIFAEHRFYGESLPFGKHSFEPPNIGLLSIEQTLADFAVLLEHIKEIYNASESRVIAFGGSYGGMLSAYMRFKYPNIVQGSIAASAPIYLLIPDLDRRFFFQDVTKDFREADKDCEPRVRLAFKRLDELASKGAEGMRKISAMFRLCHHLQTSHNYTHFLLWVRNAFTNIAMMDYPYPVDGLPGWPVKVSCDLMKKGDVLIGLAATAGLFYNKTGSSRCFDIYKEFTECADPTSCGDGPAALAWDYQACTEVESPRGSDNVTDMFPVLPFTHRDRRLYCRRTWGVTERPRWGGVQFWGRNIKSASNIVFSNGNLDPWRRGGVLTSLSPSLIAVLVHQGAHHLDLRGSNPSDPISVIKVRELEEGKIAEWINC